MINDVNVLVVEDDLALQEAIIDTLKLSSIKASSVPSAEKALELLGKQKFDMVISDVNMPGMDGFTLGAALRKKYETCYITMLTANVKEETQNKAKQLGFGLVSKPISNEKMKEILTHI